jgi:ABC-type nickel/cobalt efflux system permease component RcnA
MIPASSNQSTSNYQTINLKTIKMKKSTPWLIGILAALITFVSLFSIVGQKHHYTNKRLGSESYAWDKNHGVRHQGRSNNATRSWHQPNDKAQRRYRGEKPWDINEKHPGK